jgi:predicted protein tyrosine phosphatase
MRGVDRRLAVRLVVCPLSQLGAALASRPSHLLSLLSPEAEEPQCPGVSPLHRLVLRFNDITQPMDGLTPPDRRSVQALIEFGRSWPGQAPLLIHCWAGISRSTAAAYVIACEQGGDGQERRQALALRRASPQASPNALMVAIADEILGRSGNMIRAISDMGRGAEASEGALFDLEIVQRTDTDGR